MLLPTVAKTENQPVLHNLLDRIMEQVSGLDTALDMIEKAANRITLPPPTPVGPVNPPAQPGPNCIDRRLEDVHAALGQLLSKMHDVRNHLDSAV